MTWGVWLVGEQVLRHGIDGIVRAQVGHGQVGGGVESLLLAGVRPGVERAPAFAAMQKHPLGRRLGLEERR